MASDEFNSGVAEATYRQVIENALSAVQSLPHEQAVAYLQQDWQPFAEDVKRTWEGSTNG